MHLHHPHRIIRGPVESNLCSFAHCPLLLLLVPVVVVLLLLHLAVAGVYSNIPM